MVKIRKGVVLQVLARQSYETKTKAAILVQKRLRLYCAKKLYRKQKLGVVLIQRQWRLRMCQRRFKTQGRGFTALQLLGKQHYQTKASSVTKLQTHWRMVTVRCAYREKRAASIVIQTRFRGAIRKAAYEIMRPGFVALQVLAKLWFQIKNLFHIYLFHCI